MVAAPYLSEFSGESLRSRIERKESQYLAPQAQLSRETKGRLREEPECPLRTAYQRDRDRIVHCKAFRRLKHKTQVFISPTGDHYRTRLTHTLEVSQIARTIGRALSLNEDLIEAIALGHDLGHTAFGHGGERALNSLVSGGFYHNEQSLRIVDELEKDGRGLNLTLEVRDGILKHSKGRSKPILGEPEGRAMTLEGRVVRLADIVAYLNHDLDDALRAEILTMDDIPKDILEHVGRSHGERIHRLVENIVFSSLDTGLTEVRLSEEMLERVDALRTFLFERVYDIPPFRQEFHRVRKIIGDLYEIFMTDDAVFRKELGAFQADCPRERQVCDHIAGMTDRYALDLYSRLFLPRPWMKVGGNSSDRYAP
ncbi:MAG: deoxyguanosinetriphosphate triphosphohydrolase [Deltaproteobacteria bacterium]|nr:deoxyguanosinetriphosphate triphosphohydrolase [Deltaproteobacteria bacterium]